MSTVIFLVLSIVIAYIFTLLKSNSKSIVSSTSKQVTINTETEGKEFKTESATPQNTVLTPSYLYLNDDYDDDDENEDDYQDELDDIMEETMKGY